MPLDRQFIEKKDFPVGHRGYDPDAVDAHLAVLADEIAEYKRSARRRADTLASSASEQVRAIVEAAEASAAEITRQAESEARDIREEANAEARTAREGVSEQAREQVRKISEATSTMLSRLGAIEQEMSGLIESLRAGANRIGSDLELLEADLAGVSEAAALHPRFEPEEPAQSDVYATDAEPDGTPFYDPDAEAGAMDQAAPAEAGQFDEITTDTHPFPATEPTGAVGGHSDDAEGARLIALNMALNGTPREETARYLSENFQLADAGGLLDEVYASVEG